MLRTYEYVINQLTEKTIDLLSHPSEVKYFSINGCSHYMCWLDEKKIAFGSGVIEVLITDDMNRQEINSLFATYIVPNYSDRIDYYFWREIKTMNELKKECPWFNMWCDEQ